MLRKLLWWIGAASAVLIFLDYAELLPDFKRGQPAGFQEKAGMSLLSRAREIEKKKVELEKMLEESKARRRRNERDIAAAKLALAKLENGAGAGRLREWIAGLEKAVKAEELAASKISESLSRLEWDLRDARRAEECKRAGDSLEKALKSSRSGLEDPDGWENGGLRRIAAEEEARLEVLQRQP